jgi:hypothetical protein
LGFEKTLSMTSRAKASARSRRSVAAVRARSRVSARRRWFAGTIV